MRFSQGPQLAFRDHRHCAEDDCTVLPPLETKHLARVALAERDLAALAYNLDLDAIFDRGCRLFHAIMLACDRAVRKSDGIKGASGAIPRRLAFRSLRAIDA